MSSKQWGSHHRSTDHGTSCGVDISEWLLEILARYRFYRIRMRHQPIDYFAPA